MSGRDEQALPELPGVALQAAPSTAPLSGGRWGCSACGASQAEELRRRASRAAYQEMRAQGFSGGWDHDALVDAILSAMRADHLPEGARNDR